MTWLYQALVAYWWLALLIVAAWFVAYSLCSVSAQADRDAEQLSEQWRLKERR